MCIINKYGLENVSIFVKKKKKKKKSQNDQDSIEKLTSYRFEGISKTDNIQFGELSYYFEIN